MKKLVILLSVLAVNSASAQVGEYAGNVVGLYASGTTPEKMEAGAYAGRCFAAPAMPMGFIDAAAVLIVLKFKTKPGEAPAANPQYMMNIYYPNAGKLPLIYFDQQTAEQVLASTKEIHYPFYTVFDEYNEKVALFGEKPLKYTVRKNGEYWVVKGSLTQKVMALQPGPLMHCYFFKKLSRQ